MNHITQKQAAKLMEAADEAATKYLRDEGEFHPDHHEVAAMFLCNYAIQHYIDSAASEPQAQGDADEYQYRTKPTWDANAPWSNWTKCNRGSFEDYKRTPLLNDWIHEARALYTHPQSSEPKYPAKWPRFLHYPECWDTAAYPTLESAIHEALAWSGCSVCKPPAPTGEPNAK
jgi:hypothetical protein